MIDPIAKPDTSRTREGWNLIRVIPEIRAKALEALGADLASAWVTHRVLPLRASDSLPQDRTEAYFVQDYMAEMLSLDQSGWKVGATSQKMRELDGHSDVIPGRVFAPKTWLGSNVSIPADSLTGARAETEFAFRLTRDLPLRSDPWKAEEIASYAVLHPAIEIIGNRFDLPEAPREMCSLMTIADNGGGIGFVFGNPVTDWHGVDFQSHAVKLTVDDGYPAENFLGEMRCVPINAMADLANHLATRGVALSEGDFVSTGAATVPQPVKKGSRVHADFGRLGQIQLEFT